MLAKAIRIIVGVVALLLVAAPAPADWDSAPLAKHSDYQAVDTDGKSAWGGSFLPDGIKMRGVILNNPEDMLDGSPYFLHRKPANYWRMGGQWQIFFQTVETDDIGGTACWMGQNYGNHQYKGTSSLDSYDDEQWLAELNRLNHDPTSGHQFRAGDLVEIRARIGLWYKGKMNVNEDHDNDYDRENNWDGLGSLGDGENHDFEVHLIQAGHGLPTLQEMIGLSDVKDISNNDKFDQTRASGGELYQARLVKIRNVSFQDTINWGPDNYLTLTDGTGRTLPCRLGMKDDFANNPAPTGTFDVVGIFNQEAVTWGKGIDGYELWVMDYEGNFVPVPEPGCVSLLVLGGLAMLRRRRNR